MSTPSPEHIWDRLRVKGGSDLPWSWDSNDKELVESLSVTLVDFVRDYKATFVVKQAQLVPYCWPAHPGLAREIASLYASWASAFHGCGATSWGRCLLLRTDPAGIPGQDHDVARARPGRLPRRATPAGLKRPRPEDRGARSPRGRDAAEPARGLRHAPVGVDLDAAASTRRRRMRRNCRCRLIRRMNTPRPRGGSDDVRLPRRRHVDPACHRR